MLIATYAERATRNKFGPIEVGLKLYLTLVYAKVVVLRRFMPNTNPLELLYSKNTLADDLKCFQESRILVKLFDQGIIV